MRGHIKNIYELYDLPVNDIFEMIDGLFSGDLSVIKNPVEKMDGQNLTFTVIDGNLRFFFKGTTLTSIKSGGLDAAGIREKYASDEKASVRQAYLDAYESLKHLARSHSSFFRNGHVVIEAALIDPRNINTIPYKNPGIYFVVSMVESHIVKYTFIPAKIRKDAARRLVMKRGPIAGSFKKHGMGDSWDLFKKLERQARLIVAEARIPLDNIIQKIGAITFRAVDFQLNAGDPSEIRKGIRIIKSGFADSRLIGTPEQINEIRILLKCIKENEALIEKSTEGFVFEWKGHETKLVGMFTPVNRLNALFTYGDKPVTFSKRSYRTNIYNDWENWYGW